MGIFDFSGKFGYSEGAFERLRQRDEPLPGVDPSIVQDTVNPPPPSTSSSTGGLGVTVGADGSDIAHTAGISATARTAEGDYLITVSAAGTLIPTATIDYISGNGGGGLSPYKEFSGFEVALTDNTNQVQFEYSPVNDLVIALGPDTDDLWKHDPDDWTTAAVQEDANSHPVRTRDYSGVVSEPNGTYVVLSGDSSYPLRVYNIGTDTWYNLGNGDKIVIAANDTSGLDIYTSEGTTVNKYTPNLGTPALGSAVWTKNVDIITSNLMRGAFDFDGGNLWVPQGGYLYQFRLSNGDNVQHKYPADIHTPGAGGGSGSPGGNHPICFDPVRRCMYVMLHNVLTGAEQNYAYVYEYRDWSSALIASSGSWFRRITIAGGLSTGMAIGYNSEVGILGLAINSTLSRYAGYPISKLDEIPIDDTIANIDIDYDLDSAHGNIVVQPTYIVVSAQKGGLEYLIKVEYEGDDLPLTGSGGAVVGRGILIAAHATSSTTVRVITYLATSPHILVDAQFHCHIDYGV